MALNSSKRERISSRRERVAKRRIQFSESQRELAAYFNVSVATINNDLKVLDAEWRRKAAQDTETLRAQQLAEIDQVKRIAWIQGYQFPAMKIILQAVKLEAQITGTLAPPSLVFNMTILVQLAKAIQDSGMSTGDALEAMFQAFAQKKQQEGTGDEAQAHAGSQTGQELSHYRLDEGR